MNLQRTLRGLVWWFAFAFGVLGCRGPSPLLADTGSPPVAEEVLDRSGAVTVRYPSSFSRLIKPGFMVIPPLGF